MENRITPDQALANLYNASRLAPLPAGDHEIMKESAIVLQKAIAKKEEPKKK